jgi:hypothetical protein
MKPRGYPIQGYRLCIYRTTRGRLRASIGVGLAAICAACLIPGASASAASRSASELRRAFAQTILALRVTGNAAVCSSTTPEGQIALIEMLRGGLYLPTTTCSEAFAGRAAAEVQHTLYLCGLPAPTVSEFGPVVKKAVIHVRGNRGTVQLVYDFLCGEGEVLLTGSTAVARDPMGTSHWVRKRGRWVFANQPTGTYRPSARKAVAMLRAALNGRTVTVPEQPLPEPLTVGFCANGVSHSTFLGQEGPDPRPWYVTSGYSVNSVFPYQLTPPFDTQGNPQGEVLLIQASIFSGVEWGIKLVGGAPVVTEPSGTSLPVSAPGAAGC